MSDDIPGTIDDMLRFGTVQSVEGARAVVKCGEIVTPPVRWLTLAGLFGAYMPLSQGEQVAVLCPSGDISGAIILGGLYSTDNPPPADGLRARIKMPDGAVFDYDPGEHLLTITLPDGTLALTGGLTITGDVEITGDVSVTGDTALTGDLTVSGASTLGADATQFVKLATDSPATTVKAK